MVDWGNVPGWVAACSASGGVIAASFGAGFAYRNLRVAERGLDDRVEAERRNQANRVAAWLQPEGIFLKAMLANNSELPVYQVVVGFISPNHDNGFHLSVLSPTAGATEFVEVTGHITDARTRYPNIDASLAVQGSVGKIKQLQDGKWVETFDTGPVGLTIAFTDAQGARWERELDGCLVERSANYKAFRGAVGVNLPEPDEHVGANDPKEE